MNCINCNNLIDANRLEALAFLGKLPHEYLCLNCASHNDNKIKGLYENGELILSDNIGPSGIPHDNSINTSYDSN